MKKFNKTLRGYNPEEVNAFLDEVIGRVEKMVIERRKNEKQMRELLSKVSNLEEQINRYKALEGTMNQTIVAAQDSGEQIRRLAKQERDMVVNEARKNANRIINEALMRSEKIEYQTSIMRKNISLFKKRLRGVIENQLEMIDDIEILEI
ncbi:MAG: DivIVA domain-containing protein [Bacilli bacterium]|jgi:cell division initiation protein